MIGGHLYYTPLVQIVILAYSLMSYVSITEALCGAATPRPVDPDGAYAEHRDKGRDKGRDAARADGVAPVNGRLVEAGMRVLFSEMAEGLWSTGQPIFIAKGRGNDVGNAFVFASDLLASLLETLPPATFRPHLAKVSEHAEWLRQHEVEQMARRGPDGRGAVLRGWRSNHLPPDGGPLGWCTAQVGEPKTSLPKTWSAPRAATHRSQHSHAPLTLASPSLRSPRSPSPYPHPTLRPSLQAVRCISRLRQLTRELLVADVLTEFGGRQAAAPDTSAWSRLLDSDLPAGGGGGSDVSSIGTLKDTIDARMLAPLSALGATDPLGRGAEDTAALASQQASSRAVASYSAILFGPPGTAKTTVVDAIARRLGWGFVTIDTSVFLADGLTNVAARISAVFEKLQELERTIILFDEVEEFCLDRSIPTLAMESRMLTTAMLTKLADLRGARRAAFFIATNRLTVLDAAVTRPGRFDLQLFVGTPNLPSRMGRFRARLDALPDALEPSLAAAAVGAFEAVLARRWAGGALFLTFLEAERLAADAIAAASAHAVRAYWSPRGESAEVAAADPRTELQGLLETEFEALLDAQAATMTVRGTVREDFLEAMRLSRM